MIRMAACSRGGGSVSHAGASRAGEIGRDAQQRQFVSRGRQIPVVCNFWRVKREVPREAKEQADDRDSRGWWWWWELDATPVRDRKPGRAKARRERLALYGDLTRRRGRVLSVPSRCR